ncbi:MAG: VanZ family protein [Lactobacillus sp.]|uniref:VanZ family protein n=1 Tax=Bombilactobacillus bombi TaxID=1303590 RepID=UPI0038F7537B|nr:VanZ family protein [Lactobacillus sp.]
MIFLNSIYQQVYFQYSDKINHFPLIRLIFYSLDKTIFYFLLFLIIRVVYLLIKRKKSNWKHEILLSVFTIYLLLLFFLTVFRHGYFPWDFHFYWHRSLSNINFQPLVQTFKLTTGTSILDFIYNFGGNIAWFIPWGLGLPLLNPLKINFSKTVFSGMLLSVLIESLQFVLFTGVSDIDDIIFNTVGAAIGYACFALYQTFMKKIKK